MTVRTTVAFDPATAARLERLAKHRGVSKSQTLRRTLEHAELAASPPSPASPMPSLGEIAAMAPGDARAWLRSHTLVTKEQGALWRAQLQETREDFATCP